MEKTSLNLVQSVIFLFLSLPFHGSPQDSALTNQELRTLLQLKQYWSSPLPLYHWNDLSNHCTWPEINCTDGSVTKLVIFNKTIAGTIPSFICDLSNLSHIDLQYSSFYGDFPDVLYGCSKLEYLDISNNSFTGKLPDDINRFSPRLRVLNVGFNEFDGAIPSTIGSLPQLTSLQLFGNKFNGSIPLEIGDLLNLEELNLNYLLGFETQIIPPSFMKLKKLRNLWMNRAKLIGEIPESIGNLSALEFIDLSENDFHGSIPSSVFLLKNLSTLFLYKNNLSGSIPRTIEALNLLNLDLSMNQLTGTIPEDLGNLSRLTYLYLFDNGLSGEMPASLGRLPELVEFSLFTNNLSGELPPDFGRYSKLKIFQVAENRFTGALPQYLCYNEVLFGIAAFDNQFTGDFPPSLGNCTSLAEVLVYNNSLSGEIPDGIWRSTKLRKLMISNNLFTGQLPSKLGPKLALLELQNNRFSGPIPAEMSFWGSLRELKASNNLLSGVFPQQLRDVPVLSTLLLDGNRLSGELKLNIASWKDLTMLNLSGNELSGEIPPSLGSLPDLLYLDLSRNEFSGPIPPQIGYLRLSSLNLSSNNLYGKIPRALENEAFGSSFLDNQGLCSNNPSLGLNECNSEIRITKKASSEFITIVSSLAAVAFLVAFLYVIFLFKSYQKKKKVLDANWKLTSFQRHSLTESNILSNLTDSNLIGIGGSGKVYRVSINRMGESVAVKKIWDQVQFDDKLEKEFLAEVQILGTIRHSNIVKLICCMSSEESKLLVYEYMENRSLDRWLHVKNRITSFSSSVHHMVLDWPKRLHIAIGAAQGLCYMHHECSPTVIHGDVKSSNILLDSEFNAKIADFGLARTLIKNGEPKTVSVVAGSFGYIAPEYAQTIRVNEKIDVFSYGVVLLELVTGRDPHNSDGTSLVEWTWQHIREGKPLVDEVDEDIKEADYMDEIDTVLKLGITCTSNLASNRPTMRDVVKILVQCSQRTPLGEKRNGNEFDIAPLLRSSERERRLESDDSLFASLV